MGALIVTLGAVVYPVPNLDKVILDIPLFLIPLLITVAKDGMAIATVSVGGVNVTDKSVA